MRYFIFFGYDGTNYHGWQIQPNANSVQQELQRALSILLRKEMEVVGAGRTDTGVHARHMAAHFDTDRIPMEPDQLVYRLNRILPRDIAVYEVREVAPEMHARFSAISRTYHYYIHTQKDPFERHYSLQMNYPLNFEKMNEAAQHFLHHEDYAAFCKAGGDNKTTICHVTAARWIQTSPTTWYFEITANRFLRNMVRAVVGTLIDVGREKITMEQFLDILHNGSRSDAGESMPGNALFLEDVGYDFKDVLYIADRHKKEFTYPIHNHSVYELNFVENAKGVRRIVGDSQEVIGDYDLCLITSPDLEHVWEQNECHSDDIREITIQFDFSMSDETLFGRNPYASITRMMQEAKKGLSFPMQAIMKVYGMLDTLSSVKDGFYAVQQFLTILYELSRCENARTLASSSYAKVTVEDDSRRILKVKNFISKNYMDELRLPELASLAGMSSSAFSRFFKLHTGRNISEYIIDLRLGYAARMLVDTAKSISEIGFDCGFNNLSNFNRIFKKKKGCSPSEFRESYHKTRIIV
jgi:tRNA pseudouridine(38-40) synthase